MGKAGGLRRNPYTTPPPAFWASQAGQAGEGGGGGDLIKTDKCKPEVMHSTVRHKCIFILYAKPG